MGDARTDSMMGSDARPDAGPCWPISSSMPGGTIELGTGDTDFIPMPTDINLVFGSQGGFHIPTRARIHGLVPGNPTNVLDPENPRTFTRNYFIDTGLPTYDMPCPARTAYVSDNAGAYVSPNVVESRFFEALGPADLFDKQFRVRVEIIDSTGAYAFDEKVVTARAPIGWFQNAGVPPSGMLGVTQ